MQAAMLFELLLRLLPSTMQIDAIDLNTLEGIIGVLPVEGPVLPGPLRYCDVPSSTLRTARLQRYWRLWLGVLCARVGHFLHLRDSMVEVEMVV